MKPPPFEYHAPATVTEVLRLLATLEEPKLLAGGQSLIPLLNFRLARPANLIDINRVGGLDRIYERDGGVAIGACVRQSAAEHDPLLNALCPVVPLALRQVAHSVIRNRGTVCGSIAHADPAAELPAALLAAGGHAVAVSGRGERTIPAGDLFLGIMETSLEPDELIREVWFPRVTGRVRVLEESRRHGDFALAGLVLVGESLALFGVAPTPVLADPSNPTSGLEPGGDLEASPAFRLSLVETLVGRALAA